MKRKKDDKWGQSLSLSHLGVVQFFSENWDQALSLHLKAKELRKKISDNLGTASSYHNLALIEFYGKKNLEKSKKYHEKAKKIRESLNDTWGW